MTDKYDLNKLGLDPSEIAAIDDIMGAGAEYPLLDTGLPGKAFSDQTFNGQGSSTKGGTWAETDRCYTTHPALTVGAYKVYGGSCYTPVVKDADVYVGLDSGMTTTPKAFPWNPGYEVKFTIPDGNAPSNPIEFIKMIDWLAEKIKAGAKVHVGCIGGHGRTGMVLAALVKVIANEEDAISYVRKNYCKKAVETAVQVNFLNKHFGIKKVEGSKSYSDGKYQSKTTVPSGSKPAGYSMTSGSTTGRLPRSYKVIAMGADFCMWGKAAMGSK